MATQTNRTYSEFFSSGLRAMSGTSYSRPDSGYSSSIIPSAPPNALKSSGRYNVLRSLTTRRPRTSSSPASAFMSSSENTTTTSPQKQQRRSSIVALPSRLLGRMMNSPDTWSLPDNAVRRSEDALYTPRSSSSYEKIRPDIDPFDASPNSKSFFIDFDYVETPPTPVSRAPPPRAQRAQSFLLLGEPTKTASFINLPARRRARPTSIQSMPLPRPSQSRRSSLQYAPMSRDKYDRSWALEEEETFSPAWSDAEELHDPAATIDWRQFHNDLLHEDQF